ncbi:ATP-dependent RNA helicase DDX54 isoform X1 [Latimeria chalumnae]|uniref:ATP-dependent RNA helicase DDX54 isoform X1 n=1 Tax=Latimeria chalumnae TaxID=7897 RepID=UPI0003C11702|nr:PREDICTED: ATP-dependent RNA helicase DDX54 isoform X1 [Latimeria chalumnae]|eukprot:XP_006005488.1 PREDICTED: ATP-dependent RNA helicase DDX54 isoform X1 [Latimeria chalumnae]
MAQKKKAQKKKKQQPPPWQGREPGLESDGGEFDLAAQVTEGEDGTRKQKSCKRLPSFPTTDYSSDVELDTREMVRAQNRKKKSGGFQSMGLSYPVFKGVMKKGYKIPTPIQRKTIPVIMDGKDVVAMARTGSGKTACFLIPMFEKLKAHSAQTGARALILSPTRELALQTLKFTKELGKFTGLKTVLILGGDRMEEQFAALHENPDIIIATPGRLMHVVMEMNLKLHGVEYVVFDEADRLFEMGFAEQLQEVIRRLPESRQTVLFSATLPKLLVEFARAGLTEPVLIRLDVDTKLSENLKLAFFHVRADDKPAVLLHLLRNVVKPQEQTVVFAATKHHIEYLKELLLAEGIDCAHIYSALDQTARKINIGKFVHRKCMVMIVTDVAARGIDIPMLDNVINYNFPPKAKLFLHRVGRVARAGRSGTAYSLVAPDEVACVFDLHLFLGRPLKLAISSDKTEDSDGVYGRVPQSIIDDEEALLITDHENSLDLQNLKRVSENAYKQYTKSRPNPSAESVKRAKDLDFSTLRVHPLLGCGLEDQELERLQVVDSIKNFKSKATIFEINSTNKTLASEVMRAKRKKDRRAIDKFQKWKEEKLGGSEQHAVTQTQNSQTSVQQESDQENLQEVFTEVVGRKRKQHQSQEGPFQKKKKGASTRDEEFYIPYRPKDFDSERGLSVKGAGSSFEQQASGAILDLMGDEDRDLTKSKQMLKWDRKKKKFVRESGREDKKKVKTESGRYISKSYKKNLYEEWKKKYKIDDQDSERESDHEGGGNKHRKGRGRRSSSNSFPRKAGPAHRVRSELKSKEQILKQRKRREKQQFLQSGGLKRLKGKMRRRQQEMKKTAFGRGGGKKGKLRKRL